MSDLAALKEYATARQIEYIDAVIEHGTARAAAEVLGVHHSAIGRAIEAVRTKAARQGHAPGHFVNGVAPGFQMGKVTVQRGADGTVERTWERQSPEAEEMRAALRAFVDGLKDEITPAAPVASPGPMNGDLCNLYTYTDYHLGMMAEAAQGGADWNLDIAQATLTGSFAMMIDRAPPAGHAVVNIQGDFLHTDGLKPVTPGMDTFSTPPAAIGRW